ncbi:prepilin peptidase [Alkalihalobacillus sp. MEB130]|uniref:prepilin peptidase n=1 Tax=Alkalihalobacillus sp. MEB130 TaxID=2976704 RepID=UPI0028DF29CF|nr:prepilin peptidase [Alkalihalobacillus sp. MEB130]MDT8859519.1 prepilin peptidase [Alkalihalobacillus sp. MEB130]
MEVVLAFYFFVLGLILGSFYNVVGIRVPKKESILSPARSYCPTCSRTLTGKDLVPVFSFLFLKGKCRGCQTKISPIYPFMELTTGLLFLFSFLTFGLSYELLVSLLFCSMLIIITVTDIRYMIIPDKILLCFLPILILLRVFVAPLDPWWDFLLGAISGFLVLLLIALVSRGGMGGGDIKLFGVIGIVLGFQLTLLTLVLSSFYGAIYGVIGLLTGKVKRGTPFPFGPFIVLAALTCYFFGSQLIHWYLQLFL